MVGCQCFQTTNFSCDVQGVLQVEPKQLFWPVAEMLLLVSKSVWDVGTRSDGLS